MELIDHACDIADMSRRGSGGAVSMRPIYVGGCLGWLHAPADQGPTAGRLGALLCPALGREARWSYRSLRQLADRCAAAGLPTLRVEYPGTGDSRDLAPAENHLAAWQDSLQHACDALRSVAGVDRLALVGLRFGALLAADAASRRDDVEAVALLAPVLSGRAYGRELRIATIGADDAQVIDDGIELDGGIVSNATLTELAGIDLPGAARAPAGHTLLLGTGDRLAAYAEVLRRLDSQVTLLPFVGYEQMMRVATSNHVPHAALDEVAEWLGRLEPAQARVPIASRQDTTSPSTAFQAGGYAEHAVQFGSGGCLAGVLCKPGGRPVDQAVLITNTGGDPRAGIGRFGVLLARRLASAGIASLRFDFGGLGDSRLQDDVDGHLYELDRSDEIVAALDLLQEHGYRRLYAFGVCTGAYHLMHAAIAEPRIQRLVVVNLVAFSWRPGDPVEVAQRALGRPTGRYKQLARRSETWKRLLRGRVDLRYVARTLLRRAGQAIGRSLAAAARRFGLRTEADRPRRMIQALSDRGTRLLMLFAADDPGLAELEAHFGRNGRALAAWPHVTVQINDGFDHTVSRRAMQDQVAAITLRFLVQEGPQPAGGEVRHGAHSRWSGSGERDVTEPVRKPTATTSIR